MNSVIVPNFYEHTSHSQVEIADILLTRGALSVEILEWKYLIIISVCYLKHNLTSFKILTRKASYS